MIADDAIEAWHVSNRANLFLLERLDEAALEISSRPKARTVGDQFAHLHNVRLMWLDAAAKGRWSNLVKIESGKHGGRQSLRDTLEASATAMEEMLREGFETGKVKGIKRSPATFLAYLVAHEAHHRGQILLTLKLGGYKVDRKTEFGLWEWGTL